MSISKDLREQLSTESKSKITPDKKQKVTEMLGFMSVIAYEGVKEDIKALLKEDYRKELEGYILALSRIMKHKDAWDCIQSAFKESNDHIPKKYYRLFGQ